MNKKKEGSLSARTLKHRSEKSLPKQHFPHEHKIKSPSITSALAKTHQFIEYYHMLKQQHTFNLSSKNLFEQTQFCENNDDQFFFDIDLGVPYAESQHLDSGFQYDEKANQTINFPKVSSAKEIFTSVLDFSKGDANQLEQENFTDQEDNEETSFASSQKSSKFQKRSRKEVLPFLQNCEEGQKKNEDADINDSNQKDEEDQTLMMQKLKKTVQNREKKLKFWNNKLFELNKSSKNSGASSKVMIHANQQNSSSRVNKNSAISLNLSSENQQIRKSAGKRPKFEKEPRTKKQVINLRVEVGVERENVSALEKKVSVKRVTLNPKEQVSKIDRMMKNLKANKENEQGYIQSRVSNNNLSDRRQQILQRKPKSRSREIKQKSLSRKVL